MAHVIYFDTLAYANKLKEAGVPSKQAEIQAEVLSEIFEDRVATKQDISALRQDIGGLESKMDTRFAQLEGTMDTRFAQLEGKMDTRFSQMDVKFAQVDSKFSEFKVEIIKWVIGISAAQAALILSILKFSH